MPPAASESVEDLPFGQTAVMPSEVRLLVDAKAAASVLAATGVESPARRVNQFIECLPELLTWLQANGRVFPWRLTRDPWVVYVSEILLQRTRASAVEAIHGEFFDRFPGPAAIRTAPESEIKSTVESLGFGNQRTRSLQDVARILGEEHDDTVPASLAELERPWRVGPYSARATMIFAFDRPMALVDTNFARVMERLFGFKLPSQPHKSDEAYRLMDALVPDDPALCRATNLALLDLADAICTPSDPVCESCPLAGGCIYWQDSVGGDSEVG